MMPFVNNLTNLFIALSPFHIRCNSCANYRVLHHNTYKHANYAAIYSDIQIQALSELTLTPFTYRNAEFKRTDISLQVSMSLAGLLLLNVSIECRNEHFTGQVTMIRQVHSSHQNSCHKSHIIIKIFPELKCVETGRVFFKHLSPQ
jgi:hypothetical protein